MVSLISGRPTYLSGGASAPCNKIANYNIIEKNIIYSFLMGKKVLFGGVAGILLVAAVVGTVIAVVKTNHKNDSSTTDLQSSTKSVDALCANTDHKDLCVQTLKSASLSNTTDLIHTAVHETLEAVQSRYNHTNDMINSVNDPNNKLELDSCKTMLAISTNQLKAIFQVAGDIQKCNEDMRTWISMVMAFQESCIDELTIPDVKQQLQEKLQNSQDLSSNALTIVTVLAAVANSLSPDAVKQAASSIGVNRRLLAEEAYPSWMSAAERKLMAAGNNAAVRPDIVVAQDGSGQFRTIQEAVDSIPVKNTRRVTVYVKAGVYNEYVTVKAPNVFMYGDGARKTRVVGNKHFPVPTSQTATFTVLAPGFLCKNMGFFNTAGPQGHQAVALLVSSDLSAFFNCRMDGYQDTLYSKAGRQFYRNCVVSGTVDFIFGDAATILQNCLIIIRRPIESQMNTITAHGRLQANEPTGIVIQNCRIVPELALQPDRLVIPTFYGRPWKAYSRTIIMESRVGDVVRPEGWLIWAGANFHETCYYAEFANTGPGSNVNGRVPWAHKQISPAEAMGYTVGPFIQGNTWLAATGGMFTMGLTH